jgi:hypothetical protein
MPLDVQRRSGSIALPILNLCSGRGCLVKIKLLRLYRRDGATVPIVKEYVSAAGPVQTDAPTGIQTVKRSTLIESLYGRRDGLCVILRRCQ